MVCTAIGVTAIFDLFTHLLADFLQEWTYTASAAVTCVWKRQGIECLVKGPPPSLRRSWRGWWMGSYPSALYSMVLQINRSAPIRQNGIFHAITKEVQILGVVARRSTHCHKRWEDCADGQGRWRMPSWGWLLNEEGVPVVP
ncbi:hypothetical protein NDU88_002721 [Pleurodeles waltl]|uniref:Uncharacterized protein n=1 Tax=Pleurodeles waltl TaxID=8319 RepID=A0AAV7T3P9_PLEWA|nr:hypothetical protein NDU88_002721 [Pleurodeles waltl]